MVKDDSAHRLRLISAQNDDSAQDFLCIYADNTYLQLLFCYHLSVMTLSPPSFLEHSLSLQSQAFVGVKVMVAVEERRQFGRRRLYTVMDALKRVLPREQICINKGFAFSTYSKPRHPFFFILSSSTISFPLLCQHG